MRGASREGQGRERQRKKMQPPPLRARRYANTKRVGPKKAEISSNPSQLSGFRLLGTDVVKTSDGSDVLVTYTYLATNDLSGVSGDVSTLVVNLNIKLGAVSVLYHDWVFFRAHVEGVWLPWKT